MVKLNDLEDLAEPPLDGGPEAPSSTLRQREGMEWDADVGRSMGMPSNVQFRQDDANDGT